MLGLGADGAIVAASPASASFDPVDSLLVAPHLAGGVEGQTRAPRKANTASKEDETCLRRGARRSREASEAIVTTSPASASFDAGDWLLIAPRLAYFQLLPFFLFL